MATCNINTLLESGKCFSCLTTGEMDIIELQLLCEILSAGLSSGGSALLTGMIVMWSGTIATIPSGYNLCDGTNGTPDLRNQFIVAANADSGGQAKTTITGVALKSGGANTHTHAVNITTSTNTTSTDVAPVVTVGPTVALDGHTHDTIGNTGSGTAIPTFFALAYIMKL
jgi:hypothetical protein